MKSSSKIFLIAASLWTMTIAACDFAQPGMEMPAASVRSMLGDSLLYTPESDLELPPDSTGGTVDADTTGRG